MALRNEDSAPLREITPSTQEDTLTLVFSWLNSQVEKGEGTERCKSPQKHIVEHCLQMHSNAVSARQRKVAEKKEGLGEVSWKQP